MTATSEKQPATDQDKQRWRESVIGGRVLDLMGRPDDPHTVQVRRLWDGHYRVNVLVGESLVFSRIAHSYFVSADSDGNILTSSPTIQKLYNVSASK
jgi:hypothetical protein